MPVADPPPIVALTSGRDDARRHAVEQLEIRRKDLRPDGVSRSRMAQVVGLLNLSAGVQEKALMGEVECE